MSSTETFRPDPSWPPPQGQPVWPQPSTPPPPRKKRRVGLLATAAVVAGTALLLQSTGILEIGTVPTPTPTLAPDLPGSREDTEAAWAPGSTGDPTAEQTRGVVLITSITPSGEGSGTGMVLTSDGQVLTNYHVVQASSSVEVTIADTGTTFPAIVVGHDPKRDVALLQLQDASGLETVRLDNDGVQVGDTVTAVGNSKGAGRLTAASGSVTMLGASIEVSNESSPSGSEQLSGVFETTASAVPGDSGGPMFDEEGEVAGMTTAGSQSSSRRGRTVTTASYAVPIEDALRVVRQVRTGRDSGSVEVGRRSYLGVNLADTDLAVVVRIVEDGTPAATTGLQVGDTITSVAGIAVDSPQELADAMAMAEPGDTVPLTWTDADGQERTASVTLAEHPLN